MTRQAAHRKTAAILAGFMLLLISCNLGTSDTSPPTLAPYPTITAQATLGYAESRPVALPEIGVTPLPPSEDVMGQLLDQVESDRLMSHIRSLQDVRAPDTSAPRKQVGQLRGSARRGSYINDQFELFRAGFRLASFYTFEVGLPRLHYAG